MTLQLAPVSRSACKVMLGGSLGFLLSLLTETECRVSPSWFVERRILKQEPSTSQESSVPSSN